MGSTRPSADGKSSHPESASREPRQRSKGRLYWHYWREGGKTLNKYVGSVANPRITDRVKRFSTIKATYKRRKTLVRPLAASGLPTPDTLSGTIVEAMWKAGFFRLRRVLVGALEFQARAPKATMTVQLRMRSPLSSSSS